MSVFMVNAQLAHHPAALRLAREGHIAALGVWTLAGSWSARFGTNGVVPDDVFVALGDRDLGYVQDLLSVGLLYAGADADTYVLGHGMRSGSRLWRMEASS